MTVTRLLPPRPFLRAILQRAAWVWIFLHAISAAGMGMTGVSPAGALFQGIAAPWIWGVTAAVVLTSMQRRGESLFLANLGYARRGTLLLIVLWCAALEVALVGVGTALL